MDVLRRPLLHRHRFSLGHGCVSVEEVGLELGRDGVTEAAGPRASSHDAGKARLGGAGASLRRRKAPAFQLLPDTPPCKTEPEWESTYLGVEEDFLWLEDRTRRKLSSGGL